MKSLVLKKVNKKEIMNLVKQMVIVDKYVTIRIGETETDSISYLPMHDVVKHIIIKNEKLFGEIGEHEKPIRISFTNGAKINHRLKNFKDDIDIDMVISYDETADGDEYYATKVEFNNGELRQRCECADERYSNITITPLPEDVVQKLFDTSNSDFCFNIDTSKMEMIRSLSSIDNMVKKFVYVLKDGTFSISERPDIDNKENCIYDLKLTTVEGANDQEFVCNKNILNVMSMGDFDVCVCADDGRIVYTNETDDQTIRIVAVVLR